MTALWLQYAAERGGMLGLEFSAIAESQAIVCGAVGAAWLDQQERASRDKVMPITSTHPLYRNLNAPTDSSVLEICELALYLREFQSDPALPAIIQDLRTAKFEAVFLELAFAYRWRDGGADVHLRTATPNGEADFQATIDGLPFTVEVSSFVHDVFSSEQFRLAGVVSDTMTSVLEKRPPAAAVRIWIEQRTPGNFEAAIRASVRDACLAWSKAGTTAPLLLPAAFGRLEVSELTAADGEPAPDAQGRPEFVAARDWDVVLRAVEKRLEEGEPLYRLPDRAGGEYGRVYMRFPEDERDIYVRIASKLKKEARQLRGVPTPRVVILDLSSPEFGDVFQLDPDRLTPAVRTILRSIPELAAVFLTMRRWTSALRHKYYGMFLDNGASVYRIPSRFMHRYSQREWTWDFIGGREYADAAEYTSGVTGPFADE
jgi:hypothetical protein